MKKSDELRRTTLAMGLVVLGLSAMIAHSIFDIRVVARTTMSRLPASLTRGVMADTEDKKPSMTKLELDCSRLKESPVIDVDAHLLQFHLTNCTQHPLELINLTNGFQATLFDNHDGGALSDLVALQKGMNEIHVRLEKSPTPYSLKINANL
jgi:hypothetical protein